MSRASIVELLPAFGVFPFRWRALTKEPVNNRAAEAIAPHICLIHEERLSDNAWLLMDGSFEISLARLRITEDLDVDPFNPLVIGIANLAAERLSPFSLTTLSVCTARSVSRTDLADLLASDVGSRLRVLTGLASVLGRQRRLIIRAAELNDRGL